MGMELLSKHPGLVVLSELRHPAWRQGRSSLSMVDGLIWQSRASVAASMCCSLCCLSTFTMSGMKGCNRLEHNRSLASHIAFSAPVTSVPYLDGRPRRLLALGWLIRFNNLIAALRCKPVTCVNSSNILPLSSLDDRKYLLRSACVYSIMLRRVTLTSFGNTNFDATTPLSVTIIMTQCGTLQSGLHSCMILEDFATS